MSEDKTAETLPLPSFEASVLAQLENIATRLAALEKLRVERDLETKPNWERLHKEFGETRTEFSQMHRDVNTYLAMFDRKLDVINKELLKIKADQLGIESRVDKIESEGRPQIIVQDRQF